MVVAPRSLIFNWMQEARRFCPDLRVLDHTSVGRAKDAEGFENYDLILTTYGTLRRDMAFLKDVDFDYAVLDEAQAIKNAAAKRSQAVFALQATFRLESLEGVAIDDADHVDVRLELCFLRVCQQQQPGEYVAQARFANWRRIRRHHRCAQPEAVRGAVEEYRRAERPDRGIVLRP